MEAPKRPPTDLIKEILKIQSKYPTYILFVQVGSFYEIYDLGYLDPIADLLNLKVAKRETKKKDSNAIRFAGFPSHQLTKYLEIMIRNNFVVGVVDQTGKDASSTSKRMKRGVTRVVTPGTVLSDDFSDSFKGNHFVLTICPESPGHGKSFGLSWADINTGELYVGRSIPTSLFADILRVKPMEIVVPSSITNDLVHQLDHFCLENSIAATKRDIRIEDPLPENLAGIQDPVQSRAAQTLLAFIHENFPSLQGQTVFARLPSGIQTPKIMELDASMTKTLEIFQNMNGETSKKRTLAYCVDQTSTASGYRLLISRISMFNLYSVY